MSTQNFLIANFQTGLDRELEPWLTMDDAFIEMINYRTQRGVVSPRPGITGLAQGGRNSKENEQSRVYTTTTGENVSDTNQSFTHTLANVPVRPGSVTFTDSTGTPQTATDDGTGGFTGDFSSGTIDYNTGDVSATWNASPSAPVTVDYTHANGNPVQGIMSYINGSNTRETIIATTNEFNKYNSTNNRFEEMSLTGTGTALPTGGKKNFFSSTNYPDKNNNRRMVFVNDVVADGIYTYDGTNINKLQNAADFVDVAGSSWDGNLSTALHVFNFNERLVLIRPRTSTTLYPHRILWSGINDGSGRGESFNAPGSGFLDMPSEYDIMAATKLRSAIILWTVENVWILTTTDDIKLPFRLEQVGDARARGSQAPHSGVTWFGQSAAVGNLGIVGTDGRDSFRIDDKLPFFSRDRMSGLPSTSTLDPFGQITSGVNFADDQFWWLYPDIEDVEAGERNTRVLVRNFVEESWTTYDLSLSRMGEFQQTEDIAWDDVDGDESDSWAQWDTTLEIWDDFHTQNFNLFSIVGDHNGFIYDLSDSNDLCAEISNITQADPAVVSTEPDKFFVGDRVGIYNVSGMTEINEAFYDVTAVNGNQVTIGIDASEFTAYTSGGTMCKQIKREGQTKPFNPFIDDNKKCRLKRVHFLIDTNKSSFKVDLYAERRSSPYKTGIIMDDGGDFGGAEKKWTSISVNQVAAFHRMRIYQTEGEATERLHAIILECKPTGRLYR